MAFLLSPSVIAFTKASVIALTIASVIALNIASAIALTTASVIALTRLVENEKELHACIAQREDFARHDVNNSEKHDRCT